MNLEDDKRCLKILHMSYKQLPVYLKPCFLYMGVFPEDKVIRISNLIKLWVAEGFLKAVSGKSLEEIAKEHLEDLIGRNLVLIHKIGSTGNIKCCKIHDLLRDLCLREAEKERFYYTLTPQEIVNGQWRIVISKNEDINALSSMSLARSLIWDVKEAPPPLSLRLLRILHSCSFGSVGFLENMHQLANSRFLRFTHQSISPFEFPRPLWLFWNLQTLLVDCLKVVTAPIDIWYMPRIKHLWFDYGIHPPDPPNGQDGIVLGNLHTLGAIVNFKCSEQVVKRIPNIKKLQIRYFDGSDESYCLSNLDCLDKLESFTCAFNQGMNPSRPDSVQSLINFPDSLKKLFLEDLSYKYCWEDILDKIGVLPLLQKLTLIGGSFKEGMWETSEGQFRSLKFLKLSCCRGLQVWTTESSHFPCLEHLSLQFVYELEEIPLDFAEISTLRVIDVNYCCNSVVISAKRISEIQDELYGEEAALQVRVELWPMNREGFESLVGPNFRVTPCR